MRLFVSCKATCIIWALSSTILSSVVRQLSRWGSCLTAGLNNKFPEKSNFFYLKKNRKEIKIFVSLRKKKWVPLRNGESGNDEVPFFVEPCWTVLNSIERKVDRFSCWQNYDTRKDLSENDLNWNWLYWSQLKIVVLHFKHAKVDYANLWAWLFNSLLSMNYYYLWQVCYYF